MFSVSSITLFYSGFFFSVCLISGFSLGGLPQIAVDIYVHLFLGVRQ